MSDSHHREISDLDRTLAEFARVLVRSLTHEFLPELKQALIDHIACPSAAPPVPKTQIPVTQALERLPCGCRVGHLYAALKCGALRGRQQPHGRRAWLVDVDDLERWDAAGRPLTNLAVVAHRNPRLSA